jgi:tetratricopeptide (TPR) repeat protein
MEDTAVAYPKTSERNVRRSRRDEMSAQGMSRREIQRELVLRFGLRPRPAWREAHGWSQEEAADRINARRGQAGLDPGGRAGMTRARLSEHESWPGTGSGPAVTGRRPTLQVLAVMATVYSCAVSELIDLADRRHMPAADLLVLDQHGPSGAGRPCLDSGQLARPLRLEGMRPAQAGEVLALLDEQWHALVRTDNLLGPQVALAGVRAHLGVIDDLLRTARAETRARVLGLGARYAESAAWLHEDAGEAGPSRYWTGRAMQYAVEAGDRLMVCWVLFRQSQQAAADGEAARVAGLVAAARRAAGEVPGPMLAALLQQAAHAHAMDGDEPACHASLDQAFAAAADDSAGDAAGGHGSFCSAGYLQMQRGACWLRLGYPQRAVGAYEAAASSLPAAYRRDLGAALGGLAAARAAAGEPEQAAFAALQALDIAATSGSGRITGMVASVASGLAPYRSAGPVAELLAALGGAS